MNIVKLVVFDLDGTLVDSDKTVIRILNTIRKDLNLPFLYQKDINFLLSLGGEEMIQEVIGTQNDAKCVKSLWDALGLGVGPLFCF